MVKNWFIVVLFFFSLTSIGNAQDGASNTENPSGKSQQVKILPMPGSLSPSWWDYFALSVKDLALHIDTAQEQYNQLVNQIHEPDSRAEAERYVNGFIANLKMLQDLSNANASYQKTIEQVQFKQRYSIDEWLSFFKQLKNEQIDVTNQLQRYDREKQEVKATNKTINNLMLEYMEQGGNSYSKLMLGLKMMLSRSSNEVKNAQLKLNKKTLDLQLEQLLRLVEFSEEISGKLTVEDRFLLTLGTLIEPLEKEKIQLSTKLSQSQAFSMGGAGGLPEQRARARLDSQNITNLQITVAVISQKILILNAKKSLAELLLSPSDQQVKEVQKQYKDILLSSNELADKLKVWRIDTTNEMAHVQNSFMAISAENSSSEIKQIYQQRIKLTQQALDSLNQFELEGDRLTLLLNEIDSRLAQYAGKFGVLVSWSGEAINTFKTDFISWWSQPLFTIGDTPVSAFGLLRVILIIVIASGISSFFRRILLQISDHKKFEATRVAALYTIGRLAHYVILLIGIVIALSSIGLDFTNLALVAGALSVGIGFGLQSIVNNFVSGLILLFEGSLKVGDFIEIEAGIMGLVKEINVRSTLINTNDNVDVIVPNSALVANRVTNWTLREANRRIHVPFGVAYGSDKELVKRQC